MIDIKESLLLKRLQETLDKMRDISKDHAERLVALSDENDSLRAEVAILRSLVEAVKTLRKGEAVNVEQLDLDLAKLKEFDATVQKRLDRPAPSSFEDLIVHRTNPNPSPIIRLNEFGPRS